MAAIHFPEPTTTPPPAPEALEMFEPDPTPRRWDAWRRRPVVLGGLAVLAVAVALAAWLTMRTSDSEGLDAVAVPSVEGFAELYLRTYLMDAGEGAEDVLAPYLGYAPELSGMAPGTWYVADLAVLESEPGAQGTSVLIAVDLLGVAAGGFEDVGTHFFEVTMAEGASGVLAVGLPSEVAGPMPDTSDVARPALAPPPDNPITAAVADYLEWYLVGADGSYEGPRPTQAYRSITIRAASTPDLSVQPAPLEVEVLALDDRGRATLLSYTLEVANQQGLWVASQP